MTRDEALKMVRDAAMYCVINEWPRTYSTTILDDAERVLMAEIALDRAVNMQRDFLTSLKSQLRSAA